MAPTTQELHMDSYSLFLIILVCLALFGLGVWTGTTPVIIEELFPFLKRFRR